MTPNLASPRHAQVAVRLDRLEAILASQLVKAFLVACIIVSLVPAGTGDVLRVFFVAVFGAELAARLVLWRGGRVRASALRLVFAVVDLLAFISFLPLERVLPESAATALALLRLMRLLVLLRIARGLAQDIWNILTRREQLQQFGFVSVAVAALSVISAIILTQLAVPHDAAPNARFVDQLWWSFRQMESADNLVTSTRVNPLLFVLSFVLTVVGVFVISFIIGIGSSVVDQVVRAERRRPLHDRAHTLVFGPVHNSELLIREFVRIHAKNRQIPSPERLLTWLRHASPVETARQFPRVALLAEQSEPPGYLVEPIMRGVVYREGDPTEPMALARVAGAQAKRAILLARRELGHETDAVTIATLAAFRGQNPEAQTFVEVTDSATVPIVAQVGGRGTYALDMPRTLGMFLCQHVITPGVEGLYRDLLTADGSEIYTHVFVDDDERAALLRLAKQQATVSFAALQRAALDHGVVLLGVYLSKDTPVRGRDGQVPTEALTPWLNPLVLTHDDPAPAALGALPGLIPTATLRGLIGVTESYLPLRAFARDVVCAWSEPQRKSTVAAEGAARVLRAHVGRSPQGPKRVVVIGGSAALPSFLKELSRYVEGVDVSLFMSARGDENTPLGRRLADLGLGIAEDADLPGAQGRSHSLERGGRVRIFTHDGPDLSGFAARLMSDSPAPEAAVFLSEREGDARDERTALRILRFVRLIEEGKVPRGATLHVLAEFLSVSKGEHIQRHIDARGCGFADESCLRLTLVSTDTIQNYFMVHSAFVPGAHALYDTLLQERGQEIVRLQLTAPPDITHVTLTTLVEATAPLGAIAFAVELADRRIWLAPPAHQAIPAEQVAAIYVVVDEPHLAQHLSALGARAR